MLVARDIEAFVKEDWSMIAEDFIEENFIGIDGQNKSDPDGWVLSFPNLEAYKTEWLKQAKIFNEVKWAGDPKAMYLQVTILNDIEIREDKALAHKKFIGSFVKANGEREVANWQTVYYCRCINGTWKITGFTGYLPHFTGSVAEKMERQIQFTTQAVQHKTAGPYSPVLIIDPARLVVISGQAAIAVDGNIVGDTIETQARKTLDNCKKQLAFAGCSLDDVFKVNVYMKDLADWPVFNEVYKKYFNNPLPVRTAVQTGLLEKLLVEIELWAIKKIVS
ncbi:RidA family protein [Niabella aurantiaca]|uniref:RidA family protein n=1 Tax=Niabella aurantiaca TaxID=379900 RepID=UPI001B7FD021|nr:RidA family protein [Niabella aurantiaca]